MTTDTRIFHSYAVKFDVDRPHHEPTDDNLRDALQHCALPPRASWLSDIRHAVEQIRTPR